MERPVDQLFEMIDQQRWLMNNGLFNDIIKNNLFMYGAVVHQEVKAVDLDIDIEKKNIKYSIYMEKKWIDRVLKFKELYKSTNFWGLFRFKRMYKKYGNLNIESILDKFIKDYCGPQWVTEVKIMNVKEYNDGIYEEKDNSIETNISNNRQVN